MTGVITSVSVIQAMRCGQRQSLLRWRERGRSQHIREKCLYWFPDHDEAIDVRDAMRNGSTFEKALALTKAHAMVAA